jgi:hypothetical protein
MTQEQNKIEMYKNRVFLYDKWNIKSFASFYLLFYTFKSWKIWVFWTSFNSFYVSILYKVGVLEHHLFVPVQCKLLLISKCYRK